MIQSDFKTNLKTLARDGVLRVAINTGNRALVQQDSDILTGISPALARRLAGEINARMEPIIYNGAGKVFEDAGCDKWDIGFLAIDPMRAKKITFTQPYIVIEASFAVRNDAAFKDVTDVDAAGVQVLTSTGSAYDMHLTETIKNATLERSGTPPESFEEFRAGRCDAVAGVRASLEGAFANSPNIRILSGVLTSVHQAMVLPNNNDMRIAALDDFVARANKDGFIEAAQRA
jgi:polar amino acid transport system substrate-binding protein